MDVRIGLVYSARELEIELPDDTDVDALQGRGRPGARRRRRTSLWLTDKKGNQVAVAGGKVTFVSIGTGGDKGRIGFGG